MKKLTFVFALAFLMAVPSAASATNYLLHMGGMCSTRWECTNDCGKGYPAQLANTGFVEVDALVDQRNSMSTAVSQFKGYLDQYCPASSNNWCYVLAYSNGGAVASKTIATYGSAYNLGWVYAVASNEGGSELSDSAAADLFDMVGALCNLSNNIGVSANRNGWNHNATAGATFYGSGGYREFCETGGSDDDPPINCRDIGWPDWLWPSGDYFDGGGNDGVVAIHSAAGLNQNYWYYQPPNQWFCFQSQYHWSNHLIAYTCSGYGLEHYQMKMQGAHNLE